MTYWKTYHIAQSIPDALDVLANSRGDARLIAGGTDLLLDLQQNRTPPVDTLIDISQIQELCRIDLRHNRLFVGASVPLNQIAASPLVFMHAPALVDAVSLIGGTQVRNTATLGGNVAHALPAADGTIALLCLDAQAEIANSSGIIKLPISKLFLSPGKSILDPHHDLLVGFHLHLRQSFQSSAHRRVMRPQGVAIAILNTAIWLERNEDVIKDIRIAIGPAGPCPLRAKLTEQKLRGKKYNYLSLESAFQALMSEAQFRTSPHRATTEYRQHIAKVLLHDTIEAAWQRACE